jgi:hypothetical protein
MVTAMRSATECMIEIEAAVRAWDVSNDAYRLDSRRAGGPEWAAIVMIDMHRAPSAGQRPRSIALHLLADDFREAPSVAAAVDELLDHHAAECDAMVSKDGA